MRAGRLIAIVWPKVRSLLPHSFTPSPTLLSTRLKAGDDTVATMIPLHSHTTVASHVPILSAFVRVLTFQMRYNNFPTSHPHALGNRSRHGERLDAEPPRGLGTATEQHSAAAGDRRAASVQRPQDDARHGARAGAAGRGEPAHAVRDGHQRGGVRARGGVRVRGGDAAERQPTAPTTFGVQEGLTYRVGLKSQKNTLD